MSPSQLELVNSLSSSFDRALSKYCLEPWDLATQIKPGTFGPGHTRSNETQKQYKCTTKHHVIFRADRCPLTSRYIKQRRAIPVAVNGSETVCRFMGAVLPQHGIVYLVNFDTEQNNRAFGYRERWMVSSHGRHSVDH
jgi:hypothetical protein